MTVVTFLKYTPLPRFDGLAWLQARIDEAPDSAGPWTTIDTITLTPVEPNPAAPLERNMTTAAATLTNGWYRVVFLDVDLNEEQTPPVQRALSGSTQNRPGLDRLRSTLTGLPGLDQVDDTLLQGLLDASIAHVEVVATTSFNGVQVLEKYDGNTTNELTLFKRPATSVIEMEVLTPILGFQRIYKGEEIQLYRREGIVKIFTYKLAVEQALLNTLDYQAWGTIFPPTPNSVHVTYTYGFPQYDDILDQTSLDGGATWAAGDLRDPTEQRWLAQLQQAAVCDAAASFLAQTAGLAVGIVQSVSFDGYSTSRNPAAYGPQVQALIARRDELLARRRRRFFMATIG